MNEEFNSPVGQLLNYTTYTPDDITNLQDKHTDLRTFVQDDITRSLTMFDMATDTMDDLGDLSMDDLQNGPQVVIPGENWSGSGGLTVGPNSSYNYFRTVTTPLINGSTPLSSVMIDNPVNLSQFPTNYLLSIPFPTYPLSIINAANSLIRLYTIPLNYSDDPHDLDIFVDGGVTQSSFSSLTTPLTSGNTEFRITLNNLFNNANPAFDPSRVVVIELIINATTTGTFRMLGAIRVIPPDWQQPNIEINTIYHRLERGVPPNGDVSDTPDFTLPILWQTSDLQGLDDPKPIDGKFYVRFNTGSRTMTNSFSLYVRERTDDFMTMLDLDSLTMEDLDGNPQPDTGAPAYSPRDIGDLDVPLTDLDSRTMFDLERIPDSDASSWVSFQVTWTATQVKVKVINTEWTANDQGDGTEFITNTPLSVSTDYLFLCSFEDTTLSFDFYEIESGTLTLVDDYSQVVNDPFAFKRRKGRMGWTATLNNGDAFVNFIREGAMTYAEYQSLGLKSLTPIVGAQLGADTSVDQNLFESIFTVGDSVTVSLDNTKTFNNNPTYYVNSLDQAYRGIQTNTFAISNLEEFYINFQIFLTQDPELHFYLISDPVEFSIQMSNLKLNLNTWNDVTLRIPYPDVKVAGPYSFNILQNTAQKGEYWITSPYISQPTVSWSASADIPDPWNPELNWLPFKQLYNSDDNGIMFLDKSRQLRVRALGRTPDSYLKKVQIDPHYAQLGRLLPASI